MRKRESRPDSVPALTAIDVQEEKLTRARKVFGAGVIIIRAGLAVGIAALVLEHPHVVDAASVVDTIMATAKENKLLASGMIIEWLGVIPLAIGWRTRDKTKKSLGLL
jgi:hypothetical protein